VDSRLTVTLTMPAESRGVIWETTGHIPTTMCCCWHISIRLGVLGVLEACWGCLVVRPGKVNTHNSQLASRCGHVVGPLCTSCASISDLGSEVTGRTSALHPTPMDNHGLQHQPEVVYWVDFPKRSEYSKSIIMFITLITILQMKA